MKAVVVLLAAAVVVFVKVKEMEGAVCEADALFRVKKAVCKCSCDGKEFVCKELVVPEATINTIIHDNASLHALFARQRSPCKHPITGDHFPTRIPNASSEEDHKNFNKHKRRQHSSESDSDSDESESKSDESASKSDSSESDESESAERGRKRRGKDCGFPSGCSRK